MGRGPHGDRCSWCSIGNGLVACDVRNEKGIPRERFSRGRRGLVFITTTRDRRRGRRFVVEQSFTSQKENWKAYGSFSKRLWMLMNVCRIMKQQEKEADQQANEVEGKAR